MERQAKRRKLTQPLRDEDLDARASESSLVPAMNQHRPRFTSLLNSQHQDHEGGEGDTLSSSQQHDGTAMSETERDHLKLDGQQGEGDDKTPVTLSGDGNSPFALSLDQREEDNQPKAHQDKEDAPTRLEDCSTSAHLPTVSQERAGAEPSDVARARVTCPQDLYDLLQASKNWPAPEGYILINGMATLPATAVELLPIMHEMIDLPMIHHKDATWLEEEVLCAPNAVLVPKESRIYQTGGQVIQVTINDLLEVVMVCDNTVCSTCKPTLAKQNASSAKKDKSSQKGQGGPWFHRNDCQISYTASGTGDEVWMFGPEQVGKYSGARNETKMRPIKAKIGDNVIRDAWMCVSNKCKACKSPKD